MSFASARSPALLHLAHRREMKTATSRICSTSSALHLAHRREMKVCPTTKSSMLRCCISPVAGNEKMERTSRCDSAKISEGAGNASMNMGHGATPPKAACSDAGGFSMPTIARQMERMRSFPHFQSGNRDFRGSEYKKIPIPSFAGFLHPLPASGMM